MFIFGLGSRPCLRPRTSEYSECVVDGAFAEYILRHRALSDIRCLFLRGFLIPHDAIEALELARGILAEIVLYRC
jgi:hypothetical protein